MITEHRLFLLKLLTAQEEPSYSAIMRDLNKNDKDNLEKFMSIFKKVFDEANLENLDDADKIALMTAMKSINYKMNDAG